ncbi:calcium-binding protein [Dapis sp. BLCC M229]|uniref:calcium-binding protein n=1 Tax=Dapis sp. BLCC M229 TaxID=3400188 RepID=UPI003CE764F6
MTISWNVREKTQDGNDNDNYITGKKSSKTFFVFGAGGKNKATWHHEDSISGNGGADTLIGRDENDSLYGGTGNDILYGGYETTDPNSDNGYSFPTGQFTTVNRDAGKDLLRGEDGNDTLYAGAGDDSLYGDNNDDVMFGGNGDDTLYGGNNDDLMYGQDGADLMYGENDADIMFGQDGRDTLYGGIGADLLYSGKLGNGASDVLDGGADADTFFLGEAADTAGGGMKIDWMNLGLSMAGDVTDLGFTVFAPKLKIAKEIVPMIFDVTKGVMNGQTSRLDRPNKTASATIKDFNFREDVVIIPVDQTVYISDDSNTKNTLAFKYDTSTSDIFATLDLEYAGTVFEDASDSYDSKAEASIANMLKQNAIYIDSNGATLGTESSTTLNIDSADLENLGSNKFLVLGAYSGYNMQGSNEDEYLYGTNHDDVIAGYQLDNLGGTSFSPGNAGNDELRGFDGKDIFYGGAGNNYIDGGHDADTVSYIHAAGDVTVDLSDFTTDGDTRYAKASDNGFGGQDKLYSIEHIIGSDNADSIKGDDEPNVLSTGRGNYVVDENGNDVQLNSSLVTMGNDTLTGNGGSDTFVLSGGSHTITDFSADQGDKIQIDLKEYFNNNVVNLRYNLSGDNLTIDFSNQRVATLNGISSSEVADVFKNIEFIGKEDTSGANHNKDLLIGNDGNNNLSGFGWDDYIYGGKGNDTSFGGSGRDMIFGGDGSDRFQGAFADDILIGGYGSDTFVYGYYASRQDSVDKILDFTAGEGDKIEIDKSEFGISSLTALFIWVNHKSVKCN